LRKINGVFILHKAIIPIASKTTPGNQTNYYFYNVIVTSDSKIDESRVVKAISSLL
jgi:hypothetical protein